MARLVTPTARAISEWLYPWAAMWLIVSICSGVIWSWVPGAWTIGATVTVRKSKTTAGERRIVVPARLGVMLAARPLDDGPLFPTPLGKRRDRRNTTGEWQAARERLGLPSYTFHAFRKSVATALDQAGLSARGIAEYLGHASPAITMSTYMSKTVGGSRAADALDSVIHVRSD